MENWILSIHRKFTYFKKALDVCGDKVKDLGGKKHPITKQIAMIH